MSALPIIAAEAARPLSGLKIYSQPQNFILKCASEL